MCTTALPASRSACDGSGTQARSNWHEARDADVGDGLAKARRGAGDQVRKGRDLHRGLRLVDGRGDLDHLGVALRDGRPGEVGLPEGPAVPRRAERLRFVVAPRHAQGPRLAGGPHAQAHANRRRARRLHAQLGDAPLAHAAPRDGARGDLGDVATEADRGALARGRAALPWRAIPASDGSARRRTRAGISSSVVRSRASAADFPASTTNSPFTTGSVPAHAGAATAATARQRGERTRERFMTQLATNRRGGGGRVPPPRGPRRRRSRACSAGPGIRRSRARTGAPRRRGA